MDVLDGRRGVERKVIRSLGRGDCNDFRRVVDGPDRSRLRVSRLSRRAWLGLICSMVAGSMLRATAADYALQAPVRRLCPLLATCGAPRLASQSLTGTAGFGHSRQRMIGRSPALTHARYPASAHQGPYTCHPAWACAGDLALWRKMSIVLVGQAHPAPGADFGNGVNGISDLGIDSTEDGGEGEILNGRQPLGLGSQPGRQGGGIRCCAGIHGVAAG